MSKSKKPSKAVLKRKNTPTFIGIDLAWSNRNPSGCAVIRNRRLIAYASSLGSDNEIVAYVREQLEDECPAIIGVDAPLSVPNPSGSRRCDRELSREWRRFEAGALPANRKNFLRMNPPPPDEGPVNKRQVTRFKMSEGQGQLPNPVRGEALAALLSEQLRFSQSATVPHRAEGRLICEIYPHPAHVSLFKLDKTLKYKARAGRSYCERWAALEQYQHHLRSLRWAKPSLKRTKRLLTKIDVRTLRGSAYKAYENTLDAITCAYVVNYLWHHGPEMARTYGTVKEGHIIVPLTPEMKESLASPQT